MKAYPCAQRSDEWRALRIGMFTASCANDMLATLKPDKSGKVKGEAAARRNLRVRLALERITGRSAEDPFRSGDLDRGEGLEPDAIAAYEAVTGSFVMPQGFLAHDELLAGCSPDGLVGDDGMVQAKCPRSGNHLAYWREGVPTEYLRQITHELWIAERTWCDFVSYDPLFPESARLFIQRITLTTAERASYELAARLFLDEVAAEVTAIRALGTPVAAVA